MAATDRRGFDAVHDRRPFAVTADPFHPTQALSPRP